ncbi:MAG: hypothetical protein HZB87_02640, partial [Desulfatitalea sp.]|nr:hypothetical protein [Desulfatitalea sp.]
WRDDSANLDTIYKQLTTDLEYGLKLVREKTGRNRFFLTRMALEAPETFIRELLRETQPPISTPPTISGSQGDQERNPSA